jgi:trigger factor
MEVQVEDIGPCKKRLSIEIPPEKIDEELEKNYEQLAEQAVVPGFRKGHVPRWLIKNRFGEQVNDETKEALVAEALSEAVRENSLEPIGTPQIGDDVDFEPGRPLSFDVTLEVYPDFEIEDYKGIQLEKPSVEPTKAELKERADAVRERYAELEEITEGKPQDGDVVKCHIVLREGDEVYRDVPDHQFILGDHVLIGMTQEETTEFVSGIEVGKAAEKKIDIPDDYPEEEKRGAKMALSLTLDEVRRPNPPELTEEWVKSIGFDSMEEFNEELATAVRNEKEQQTQRELEKQLDDKLLEKADFELPEDVVGLMAERGLARTSAIMQYRGAPPELIERESDRLKKQSQESAERTAKLYFILRKIAEKERLFVTEDEVNARIEAMASVRQRSPEQVRRELEQEDRLSELRSTMREEKARSLLMDNAAVKETKPRGKKPGKKSGK